jgi:alkylation response protein AidB-like acyl-CoA dehydrogenase
MDFDLTEAQRILQNTVREFTNREIETIAEDIDRKNKLPDDLIRKMADLRLLGMTLPQEYGSLPTNTFESS